MRNVGTAALVSAYTLLNADAKTVDQLVLLIAAKAQIRLLSEVQLSKKAIAEGGSKEEEQKILHTWTDYYEHTMDSIKDLVPADDEKTLRKIALAKAAIKAHVMDFNF